METITLHISGMACGGCASNIAKALHQLDGVIEENVSHTDGIATITYDPAIVQLTQIKSAIEATGYKVAN